ncbi:MAG: cation transporter [Lachnospiraceae bacterium]|nr:cation transporter [Lachnospiraceae bacterium]
MEKNKKRERIIVRTSVIGIIANVLLAATKAIIGVLSNSIAITLDAVNNLSDGFSSIVTVIGTKLSNKPADKKHPFGYGRTEYLSTMVISLVILYAGLTSLIESIKKIIYPSKPEYTAITLLVIVIAVLVKIVLGVYVKRTGDAVNSGSLQASGQDAIMDAVISASTLVAAGVYLMFHVSLEAYLGAMIAVIILKAGYDMLAETISKILGERADSELTKSIKQSIAKIPGVQGAYDLLLDNYGPERLLASVHIEVCDTLTAGDIDNITREIQTRVFREYNVVITAVSVYSVNTRDEHVVAVREEVSKICMSFEGILQMHGFYLNEEIKMMTFDVVISFQVDRNKTYEDLEEELLKRFPDYQFNINLDVDFSD